MLGKGEMGKFASSLIKNQNVSSVLQPTAPIDTQAAGMLVEMPAVVLPRVRFQDRALLVHHSAAAPTRDTPETVLHQLPTGRTAADYAEAIVFDIEHDHLEPTLFSGQQVIAWPVVAGKWEHLHNTACVVAYNDTVTVKAIFKNELFVDDRLTLQATGGGAGSFVVARSAIRAMWEVREFYGLVPYRLFA